MKDLRELDQYRNINFESRLGGVPEEHRGMVGVFTVPIKSSKRPLRVIVSTAQVPGSGGWDHVSVSLPNRCPTWDEMDFIKRLFFAPHEVAIQLHPAESDHISNHKYCLHIWGNVEKEIPLPPPSFVGDPALGELKHKRR